MDLQRSPLTVGEQAREAMKNYLAAGIPIRQALEALGVPRRTYDRWHKLAEREIDRCLAEECEPEPHLAPYVEWLIELEQAHSQGVVKYVQRIEKAGADPDNWRANVFLLQRMAPREFRDDSPPETESRTEQPKTATSSIIERLEVRLNEIAGRRQKAIDVISTPIDAAT